MALGPQPLRRVGSTAASTVDVLGSMEEWGTRSLGGMAQFMEVWVATKFRGVCLDRAVCIEIAG